MELTNIDVIKGLAKKNNIAPSSQSGQNFLVSDKILEKIIDNSNIKKDEKVLEIGPGFGTLTLEMLKSGANVKSFEIDNGLSKFLRRYETLYSNFKLIHADVLKSWELINENFDDLDYKIISNLPYNITSKVLRDFLENKPRPKEMVLMIQKEVADRVISKPGNMSILSVAVQFYGQPEKLFDVEAKNFWPVPKVNSSVIRISGIGNDINSYQKKLRSKGINDFFRIVKIGFSAKRKKIYNNLSNGLYLPKEDIIKKLNKIGINPNFRAQDLLIDDWIKIVNTIG